MAFDLDIVAEYEELKIFTFNRAIITEELICMKIY